MAKEKSSIATYGLIPLLATVVGFVIAAAISIFVVQSFANNDHRSALGEELSQQIANQVDIRINTINEAMARLADSDLLADTIAGTPAEIVQAEALVTTLVPNAQRVRILPIGTAKADQGYPPFNYIALDLVAKSEEGAAPPLEAISSQPNFQGEKWVLAAYPVKFRDGTVRGTLFAYFAPPILLEGVTDGDKGRVRIMQQVGKDPRPLSEIGTSDGSTVYKQELSNLNWTLEYQPAAAIADSNAGNIIFVLIPAVVMLLIGAIGIVVGSSQSASQVQTNLAELNAQIKKVAAGGFDSSSVYTIAGFSQANDYLRELQRMKPAAVSLEPDLAGAAEPAAAKPAKKSAAKPAESVVDIEMVDDGDADIEEVEVEDFDEVVEEANKSAETAAPAASVPAEIFRAYDIRGVVGQSLSEDIAHQIGLAIGSEAEERGQQMLLVGYDGRDYSPALAEALISGLTASGRDVVNVGAVPTPVLYYGTHNSSTTSGVMVTGSHNPPDYNGFKVVLDGKSLAGEEIQALHQRIQDGNFTSGAGTVSELDLAEDYRDAIADDVVVAQPLKVVVDCGNGISGSIVPELIDALGCEAVPLYCEVDGSFPNHHPDPTKPENLEDLILTVQSQGADLGIGFDGDGDRLVAVTAEGEVVWPDRLLMLFAKDVVSRNPGSDVVYDVKCTRHLNSVISGFGGRPIICRTGHSYLKQKVAETGAQLGGEMSGHIVFQERWYGFDDGIYSAARLLEIVGSQEDGLGDLLKEFPESVSTPEIHVHVPDAEKFDLIEKLVDVVDFEDATISTIDGLRVDFADGWGLIRASNTEPAITLRFEADNEEAIEDIKAGFRELLQEIRGDLDFE